MTLATFRSQAEPALPPEAHEPHAVGSWDSKQILLPSAWPGGATAEHWQCEEGKSAIVCQKINQYKKEKKRGEECVPGPALQGAGPGKCERWHLWL